MALPALAETFEKIKSEASDWIKNTALARTINDSLVNLMSGVGTQRDKATWNRYVDAPILSVYDLETLYKDSALARKVIEKIPKDALRAGFSIRRKGAAVDAVEEDLLKVVARCNELKVSQRLFRGACFGRLFGGAGIVMALRGTGGPESELDPTKITAIDYLRVVDRQDFRPSYWRPDGSTERWWWSRRSLGGGPVGIPLVDLHTSRVLWFGGAETTDRAKERNEYWDLSILQALFNTLVSYDSFWASLDAQVGDASQAVFHLQGFIQALAQSSGETQAVLANRLRLMDQNRSNARALVLDAGDNQGKGREEFQVIERASLASMDKLTAIVMNRFAGDAGYPVSVLFEQAAAGTNATGENDLNQHYNNVDEFRRMKLTEPATFLVQAVAREQGVRNPEELEIVWPPLYIPKPLDVASAEKMRIDSAIGLSVQGVVLEEEVALNLNRIAPTLGMEIDLKARREALEAGLQEVKDRTVMDPSEGEIEAQTKVKEAGKPAPKASGRATKANAGKSGGGG